MLESLDDACVLDDDDDSMFDRYEWLFHFLTVSSTVLFLTSEVDVTSVRVKSRMAVYFAVMHKSMSCTHVCRLLTSCIYCI